jgi:hypothetical protein
MPTLKSLTWQNQHWIYWREEPGICAVEELSIRSSPGGKLPLIEFPNLKRLTIQNGITYNFLYLLDEQFGNANGRRKAQTDA